MASNKKNQYDSKTIEELKKELEKRQVVHKLKELSPSFFTSTWFFLRKNTAIWIPTVIISFFSIFSDYFVKEVQNTLNEANHKSEIYVEIGKDLSEYNFSVELISEFFINNTRGSDYFKNLIRDYNVNIHNVRKKEFSNRALIAKNSKVVMAKRYEKLIFEIKNLDSLFRLINPVSVQILSNPQGELFTYSTEMRNIISEHIPKVMAARKSVAEHTTEFLRELN